MPAGAERIRPDRETEVACAEVAGRFIEALRLDDNEVRPHTGLGGPTPTEFAALSNKDQNQIGSWLLTTRDGSRSVTSRGSPYARHSFQRN